LHKYRLIKNNPLLKNNWRIIQLFSYKIFAFVI
jgi:hypothetical protein